MSSILKGLSAHLYTHLGLGSLAELGEAMVEPAGRAAAKAAKVEKEATLVTVGWKAAAAATVEAAAATVEAAVEAAAIPGTEAMAGTAVVAEAMEVTGADP